MCNFIFNSIIYILYIYYIYIIYIICFLIIVVIITTIIIKIIVIFALYMYNDIRVTQRMVIYHRSTFEVKCHSRRTCSV